MARKKVKTNEANDVQDSDPVADATSGTATAQATPTPATPTPTPTPKVARAAEDDFVAGTSDRYGEAITNAVHIAEVAAGETVETSAALFDETALDPFELAAAKAFIAAQPVIP